MEMTISIVLYNSLVTFNDLTIENVCNKGKCYCIRYPQNTYSAVIEMSLQISKNFVKTLVLCIHRLVNNCHIKTI